MRSLKHTRSRKRGQKVVGAEKSKLAWTREREVSGSSFFRNISIYVDLIQGQNDEPLIETLKETLQNSSESVSSHQYSRILMTDKCRASCRSALEVFPGTNDKSRHHYRRHHNQPGACLAAAAAGHATSRGDQPRAELPPPRPRWEAGHRAPQHTTTFGAEWSV